jgi:ABC-2 type transport system permease protein
MAITEAEKQLEEDYYSAVLYIPQNIINSNGAEIIYKKQPGFNTILFIETSIENELEGLKLSEAGIDKKTLAAAKTNIEMRKSKYESGVKESKNTELSMVVGMLGGVLIYFFIFLYGAQVMRGVIEEKTSRIVEVIISSVPFKVEGNWMWFWKELKFSETGSYKVYLYAGGENLICSETLDIYKE